MSIRVLPGFVDAHLHIEAWLRSQLSEPVAGGRLERAALAHALRDGPPHGDWLVLFGLDHTQSPDDCLAVTETERDIPVLVMHRTGHAAVLNTAGARVLELGDRGQVLPEPRGLWSRVLGRAPSQVRRALLGLWTILLRQGVVGVTDATPYRRQDAERIAELRDALQPVELTVMGDPLDPVPGCSFLKVLDPRSLPGLLDARPALRRADLAVHAVEPEEIMMALGWPGTGRLRVEHASLCPPAVAEQLSARDAVVCANPGFLLDRYPAFAGLRASGEAEFLHPVASLVDMGVQVVLGSDAPVSQPGVARSIEAAASRGSAGLPFAGASIPLETACELACGPVTEGTFVEIDTAPGAHGPYTVVSVVIGGRACWPERP